MEHIRHVKRLIKLKVIITFIIIFSVLTSCNSLYVKEENTTNSTANLNYSVVSSNSTYNNKDLNLMGLISSGDLYGYWLIEKVAFWDDYWALMLSRYYGGRREDNVGKIFEYEKDYCKLGDVLFEDPKYNFEKVGSNDVFKRSNTSGVEKFNLENNIDIYQTNGIKVSIEVNDIMGTSIGRYLYMIDEERMIFDAAGLYMLAIKVDPNELKEEDIPKPPADSVPTQLFGKWEIEDAIFIDENIDLVKYIGQNFEYGEDFCILNEILYDNPHYSYDVEIKSSIFCTRLYYSIYTFDALEYPDLLKKLGIKNVDTYIVQSIVLNLDDYYFDPFGTSIYYIDEEHIFINSSEAFFVAAKVH